MSSHSCTQSGVSNAFPKVMTESSTFVTAKALLSPVSEAWSTHLTKFKGELAIKSSHSDPNMGNSKEDHEEVAFLYGSWPVLERAAVEEQGSDGAFQETGGGELLPLLCVWTLLKAIPGRLTTSFAPPFTTQSFHLLCFLHIWDGQLSYSLFSFLTMMFIDRGHSECSGHILCSSRLSLKIRAQFSFMRFNEIHFSGCCPWPDTGRNTKLISQGYTGIGRLTRTLFIGHSSSHWFDASFFLWY